MDRSGRRGYRSRVEGDTRRDGIEPRSDFPGASVDPTEARNAPVGEWVFLVVNAIVLASGKARRFIEREHSWEAARPNILQLMTRLTGVGRPIAQGVKPLIEMAIAGLHVHQTR